MVAITACSVVASGVLAWLAYMNGRKATTIAAEAAARDEEHRTRELDRRAQDERSQVALAMLRALAAVERYASNDLGQWQTTVAEVEKEMILRRSEALAFIDLYATEEDDEELHVWFDSAFDALVKLGQMTPTPILKVLPIVHNTRRGAVLWNERLVTSGQLAVGDLP